MNQQIVEYLQQNKGTHTKESLVAQLHAAGHSDADISAAADAVYGGEDVNPAPSVQSENVINSEVKYAGFWIRFVAIFIDGLVAGIVVAILIIPLSYFDESGILSSIVGFVVVLMYTILMTNKYQATLGKMAVGIKVCNAGDFGKATVGNIALREIANRVIMYVPILNLAVPFIIGLTSRKQGIHDFVAKTVVVYKDPNKKMNGVVIAIIVFVVGFVMIAIIGILASIVLVSLNSARDKVTDASAKSSISSTVPAAILCMDDGYNISDPMPGAPICTGSEGTWPELGLAGEWGVVMDGEVSDGTFEYTAMYGADGESAAVCRQTGCVFDE